jgi:geranylgeranyl transferase type-2 subunit beta
MSFQVVATSDQRLMIDDDDSQHLTMAATEDDSTNKMEAVVLLPSDPPFYAGLHAQYITSLASKLDKPTSYEGAITEHLRVSGVYWSLTALSLLQSADTVDQSMGVTVPSPDENNRPPIIDWVFECFDAKNGGFGGTPGHDAHLLYTLSAVQILALADRLDDPRLEKKFVIDFVSSLQQPDGSFSGDRWGEIDTRFTYCALSTLSILGALDRVEVRKAAIYIQQCRNLDGGFGSVIGAESHAGQVFCCIGALSIAKSLDLLERDGTDLLGWWLAERQVDSGGLNGRPEKQADVCYSWWILSSLSIMGKLPWINGDRLASFILQCQDDEDGGIADRPDDMADVFHTFFGIAGLSLLGNLHCVESQGHSYRRIDPVYALPTDVVVRLGLQGQVLANRDEPVDERLAHYSLLSMDDMP